MPYSSVGHLNDPLQRPTKVRTLLDLLKEKGPNTPYGAAIREVAAWLSSRQRRLCRPLFPRNQQRTLHLPGFRAGGQPARHSFPGRVRRSQHTA
jgi:hypothetical protein